MKYVMILLFTMVGITQGWAQKVYTIPADSTKLTGCDSNELIIENHTQAVKGFLYNTGNGRTIFKKGLDKINDSIYLIGGDTLRYNAWLQGGNRWGRTGILGTLDNNHLDLYTAGAYQARLQNNGNFLLGTTRDTMGAKFQVLGTSFFSDVVNIANYKQLNVGGIYVIDNPSSRNITCMSNQPMTYTGGKGGYALMNKVVKIGSDSSIIFSPGGAVPNALTLTSVSNNPSNTTMTFGSLRNDGPKKAVINTADYDASSLGGSTGIDLYLHPGKETYSGNQGNIILAHDGTNQRGNVLIGQTTNNGNKLQVTGGSYLTGSLQLTGTGGGSTTSYYHSRVFPSISTTTNQFDQTVGMIFSPTINFNGNYQQGYAIQVAPTYNLNGNVQHTDGISAAMLVSSSYGGIRIDQNASYAGNSGQPLFIYQGGSSDKEQILFYRNGNTTTRPIMWCNDNRPVATKANLVPMLRNTIANPTVGGGVSWIMDRYYYGTEAAIEMHYETTPDSTAHVNTAIGFYTMAERAWSNPLYLKGPNVGMGTTTPSAQLHTTGSVRFAGLTNDNTQTRVVVADANGNLYYRTLSTWTANEALRSSLAVNGPIKAKALILEGTDAKAWPDYVFDSSYKLSRLPDLEQYIHANHHLPDMADAAEIGANGINVGEHQAALLKKVEELTLYTIAQEKQTTEQQKKINTQQSQIANQQKILEIQAKQLQRMEERLQQLEKNNKRS